MNSPAPPSTGAAAKALTLKYDGDGKMVDFKYNPSKIKFQRSQITQGTGTFQETQESAVTNVKAVTFNIDNLRLEGAADLSKLAILFDWLRMLPGPPSPTSGGTAGGTGGTTGGATTGGGTTGAKPGGKSNNSHGTPKVLTLTMGSGNTFASGQGISSHVILTKVDVTYIRFSRTGDPLRADVNLQMELHETDPPYPNPTSYSPTGGKMHVTTAGDNLQRIAQATYENPSAWRDIAEANGIDDPLRVRNGRSLFLPYANHTRRR